MTTLDIQQTPTIATRRWSVDGDHTSVEFSAKGFWGLATVRGRFDSCRGSVEIGPEGTRIDLAIDADSIDTGNRRRDQHLRSADFFDVADHPQVRFASTHVRDAGGGQLYGIGVVEAAGESESIAFEATIRESGDGLEAEGFTTIDHRLLGMSTGPLKMIRPPATVHVTARLV